MNFVLDANFPSSLKDIFRSAGHDVIHTTDLPDGNESRDSLLNKISLEQQRVVITKDWDFYYSHVLQGRPWKLVFVRTGNQRLKDCHATFDQLLEPLVEALENATLIELHQDKIILIRA